MKSKLEQYKQELSELMETKNDPNTPSDIKEAISPAIDKLKSLIKEEEAKGDKAEQKKESKPKSALKKVQEKVAAKKKQPEKKSEPAKKSLTALDRCREIIAKYNDKKKADAKRVKKRIKAGKPVELTPAETIKKAATSVRAKVVEMDKGLKASEETSIISGIVKSVVSAMAGIKDPHRKKQFLSKIIENLSKLNKNIKLRAEDGMYVEGAYMEDAGGEMENDMAETIRKNIISVRHHTDEILASLKQGAELEHWLINRSARAATDLSDVAHFLDGTVNKMASGGEIRKYRVREDLLEDELKVPVGKDYVGEGIFDGKYVGDHFLIKHDGKWGKAESIDFEEVELRMAEEYVNPMLYNKMAKGGAITDNYRESLENMSDQELAEEVENEMGISYDDVMQDIEEERDTYIDELVRNFQQNMRSRGEFAKGGDVDSGGYMADGGEVDKELIDSSAKSIYDKKGMMALRNTFLQAAKADEDAGDEETAEYRRRVVSEYQSKQPKFMAKGGEVKVGDIIESKTGVKVKVVEFDPKFGGRIKVERMDEYATGKPSQFLPLKNFNFAAGGVNDEEGVDLFEDYENIPANVQEILEQNAEALEGGDYRDLERVKNELEAIGYTYEYYLDGTPYDLRKIGQKGKSEMEEDEFARGGYNYGRSWHLDRARHNKGEDWEVRRRGKYAEGGEIDSLYTRLVKEHSKGGYEKMGMSFNSFLKSKMESSINKGDTEMYYKLIEVEKMYENDFYAKGGRTLSAIMKDRKYKSSEEWEKSYKRKGTPKNPKYKKYAEGGMAKGMKKYPSLKDTQTEIIN